MRIAERTWMTSRRGILLIAVAMFVAMVVSSGVVMAAPASTPGVAERSSFASAFFISQRTDPNGETSIEIIGSLVIWFLLALSLLSIGLIGSMALTNQREHILPAESIDRVSEAIRDGRYREAIAIAEQDESFFGQILHSALREASHGFGAVIRKLELASEELTTSRMRRIEYLNVLGQVSPMIGLFGTVYGMILAFRAIVVSGGNADPILLAGGIGTALTTTFWGLVVAIPALAGYAIIRNRIDELTAEATLRAEELINQFRPRSTEARGEGEVVAAERRGRLMRRRTAGIEANLTPMIDVTFLLIVFFVLVSQIVEIESVPMQLPEPSDPRSELAGDEQRAVINVVPDNSDGALAYRVGSREYSRGDKGLAAMTSHLRTLYGGNPTLQVNLRADRRTSYQHIQPVIAAVADAASTTPNGPVDARLNIVIVVDD